jgi:capsular exopolysaccharide synthesis family protein
MERMVSSSPATPARTASSTPAVLFKRVLGLVLRYWYWFAISLAVAMALATYLVYSKVPVYQRTASILIKPLGGDGTDKTLRELGIEQNSTNLINELLLMKSSVVAEQIVRRLNLDVDYTREGRLYTITMYGRDLPLQLRFFDLADNEYAALRASLQSDGTLSLDNWSKGSQSLSDPEIVLHLGDTVETPLGRIAAAASPYYQDGQTCQVRVTRTPIPSTSDRVRNNIFPYLRDKNSSIIDIRYKDVSLARADDILNTLVTVYNEQWMKNRNQQIVSTNDFIRERLAVIEQELGNVDMNISTFKSDNLITDVDAVGTMAITEANDAARQAAETSARIAQLRSVYEYIAGLQGDSQQIPVFSNIDNGAVLQKISEYNSLILQRNNHLAYSSAQNPLVVEQNKQLAQLRNSIVSTLSNEISLLQAQVGSMQSMRGRALGKVKKNPKQANYLLSVERQQKVKESLYLFLLQKREENELSQAFTAYNTQIIEPAHGSWEPIEPVAKRIFLIAFLLGLAIPAVVLMLKELFTTTIQGREDIKSMLVPFAGEIPQAGDKKKKPKKGETPTILVTDQNRDMMNESFRVIRSNLEFLLGFEATRKVIMLTSMEPGSGKTFISANLSTAVALRGKKVLAIDLDLRRASLSAYVGRPHKGISGYLNGKFEDFHDFIVPLGPVDVLPCGALPPNPSELLYSPRFSVLMKAVRAEYDYIFLDCPPVEMVADPAIINRFADLTLFVVRAGVMEKSLLPEIDQWYQDRKFNNLALLLNGTDSKGGKYGYHRYGYHRYGYNYYGHAEKA